MKFYITMLFIIVADALLGMLVFAVFHPVRGTPGYAILRNVFFGILTAASVLQWIKVGLNMVNGYVIAAFGFIARPRRYDWGESPGSFVAGVVMQMALWGAMSVLVLQAWVRINA